MLEHVRREDEDLIERLAPRLTDLHTDVSFREPWIEVEFAYGFMQQGISYLHEPLIDGAQNLVWETGGPQDPKSDFGIRPGERELNVEIKTLLPHDERPGSPYGPFARELHNRLVPQITEMSGRWNAKFRIASSLPDFSDRLSKVAKIVEHAAISTIENEGVVAEREIEFEDRTLGYLTTRSGMSWALAIVRPSHGAVEPNVLRRLKDAQTVKNCPNVVVLNTAGQTTPTPFELHERLTGEMSNEGAFDHPSVREISGVLLYMGNHRRSFLPNPNAIRPLTEDERRIFDEPFEYPE